MSVVERRASWSSRCNAARQVRASGRPRSGGLQRSSADERPLLAAPCNPHHKRLPAWIPDEQPGWPRQESNLRTRIRSPPLYPLSYGAVRPSVAPLPSGLCRRLELFFGGLPLSELAASLRLGVDLGAEQERESGQPEPRQHDDHRRERAPRLVVRAEHAHVDREEAGGEEPDDHGEDRSRRQEPPAGMSDVGAEVENSREGEEQAQQEDRPLERPPDPAE